MASKQSQAQSLHKPQQDKTAKKEEETKCCGPQEKHRQKLTLTKVYGGKQKNETSQKKQQELMDDFGWLVLLDRRARCWP